MEILARHYRSGKPVSVELDGARIAALRQLAPAAGDVELPWIAPGLVDLQINGYLGREFSSAALTVADVAHVVGELGRFGVTRFCPTVTTAGQPTLRHALATLARACDESPSVAAHVAGIHLEGPYISPDDGPRGAHPAAHVRAPDTAEFDELQAAASGRIRLVTLSPEYAAAPQFIGRLRAAGVAVALGHMNANGQQIRAAVAAGATLSTHLGNGCHAILRRHPNYLWDQLADDRLAASLIADGHHLPPEVVRTFVRAKGTERIVLVSDLSSMAGLAPGEYSSELCRLEVLDDGRLVVAGQRTLLAGAGEPIGTGIANVMRYAGADLPTAVDMATTHPLRVLGLPAPGMREGEPADLVLFRVERDAGGEPRGFRVLRTIARGIETYCTT